MEGDRAEEDRDGRLDPDPPVPSNPELIAAAERAFATNAKIVDQQTEGLTRSIGALETLVENAIFSDKTPLAAEIRSHAKGIKTGDDRLSFVLSLVAGNKRQDVAAILAAPSYLSGLTDAQHALIREAAATTFAPTEYRQLLSSREVASRVERASGIMLTAFFKVIDKKNSPAAKASAAIGALGR